MSRDEDKRHRPSWKTIDYIGGGYVLQVAVDVTVKKHHSTHLNSFERAEVVDVSERWDVDVETWDSKHVRTGRTQKRANINDVTQPHRVVHISEIVENLPEFVNDAEGRL